MNEQEQETVKVGPWLLKLIDTTRWHMQNYVKQVTDAIRSHEEGENFQMNFSFDYEKEEPNLEYKLLGLSAHKNSAGNILVVAELLPVAEADVDNSAEADIIH